MAIATTDEAILRGDISMYLAANDNSLGALFGSRIASPLSSLTITMVTDALRWGNFVGQDEITLREITNYLIWLIGVFGQEAEIIAGGSGGGSVIPSTPTPFVYLIPILGSDFTDATNYDDTRIVGKDLAIFWNDINRFLFTTEFEYTATGINITLSGFDAVANPGYDLLIYIINP